MEKNKYLVPDMILVRFENSDIITASGSNEETGGEEP